MSFSKKIWCLFSDSNRIATLIGSIFRSCATTKTLLSSTSRTNRNGILCVWPRICTNSNSTIYCWIIVTRVSCHCPSTLTNSNGMVCTTISHSTTTHSNPVTIFIIIAIRITIKTKNKRTCITIVSCISKNLIISTPTQNIRLCRLCHKRRHHCHYCGGNWEFFQAAWNACCGIIHHTAIGFTVWFGGFFNGNPCTCGFVINGTVNFVHLDVPHSKQIKQSLILQPFFNNVYLFFILCRTIY